MFDAKSLIDMITRGAASEPERDGRGGPQSSNPLEDLLRQFTEGGRQDGGHAPAPAERGGGAPGGGLADILGQVLGQATSGVKDGARHLDDATGAGDQLRSVIEKMTGGRAPEELIEQIKQLIANNQLGAGAAMGGLGALVLGTRTGRGLAVNAAKLGALALIGGLAYKAYQNYSQGKPVLGGGASGFAANPAAAPAGSGFEADAVSNDTAVLLIRAMFASACADGRLDAAEEDKILASLKQAGLEKEAEAFIEHEIESPATAADLAAAVQSPEQALQIYAAARIAVDVDTADEKQFLSELASELRLDPSLVAHLDAEARAA